VTSSRDARWRKWTAQEKAALLAEVETEGGKVTIVARRHRISESVLYNWRAAWKAAAAVMRPPVAAPFIPLEVLGGLRHRDATMLTQPQPGPPEPETPRPMRTGDGGVGGIEIAPRVEQWSVPARSARGLACRRHQQARGPIQTDWRMVASRLQAAMAISSNPLSSTRKSAQIDVIS
jgi:transposase